MDMAYLHLTLNHFPLMGAIFGTPILVFAILRKNVALRNTAFVIFVFAAAIAVPVYLTGEPAEDIVEHLPGVSKAVIHAHEDSAMYSLWTAIVTGIVSLIGLFMAWRAKAAVNTVAIAVLVLGIATTGLMAWTTNLGGQVRHTEVRDSIAPQQESGRETQKKDEDDDDK